MRCNAGRRYARVLPLPVCARATISFPDNAALMHSTCSTSTLLDSMPPGGRGGMLQVAFVRCT